MKRYNVCISEEAEKDLDEIYYKIAAELQSFQIAEKQYYHIIEKICSLETMPNRIKIMDNALGKRLKLRRLIADSYSIFFRIEKDEVIVSNVVSNSFDIERRQLS